MAVLRGAEPTALATVVNATVACGITIPIGKGSVFQQGYSPRRLKGKLGIKTDLSGARGERWSLYTSELSSLLRLFIMYLDDDRLTPCWQFITRVR